MAAAIPTEVAVKVRAELGNAVIVRPGDKLVVARSDTISMEDGARLKAVIASKLPGVEVVIVSQCSGLAVYRNEQPTDDDLKAWIGRNPQEFERWVRRQNRIMGTRVYGR